MGLREILDGQGASEGEVVLNPNDLAELYEMAGSEDLPIQLLGTGAVVPVPLLRSILEGDED